MWDGVAFFDREQLEERRDVGALAFRGRKTLAKSRLAFRIACGGTRTDALVESVDLGNRRRSTASREEPREQVVVLRRRSNRAEKCIGIRLEKLEEHPIDHRRIVVLAERSRKARPRAIDHARKPSNAAEGVEWAARRRKGEIHRSVHVFPRSVLHAEKLC